MNDAAPVQISELLADIPRNGQSDSSGVEGSWPDLYLRSALRASALLRWQTACPEDLQKSDWNHPDMVPHRKQIDHVLAHQCGARGLIASGPTGSGKTRSMWQLMHRLACDEGRDVRYYHAAEWFATLQAQISYGRDDAAGWIEAVARRPVVFIDDLGQESLLKAREDWAQAWFFRFLDIRVGRKLPLYVTTNLHATDIAQGSAKTALRSDPLLRRLLDVCEPVRF